jgi:HEPN domain-containing protein
MNQTDYRLKLAQGFLNESQQDVSLKRWRSTVDNAQLSIENSAKAVLALIGPVGRTHQPAIFLRQAVQIGNFPSDQNIKINRLAELSELLGHDVHIQTDYGDEMLGQTPWELFDKDDAEQAVNMAVEALSLAQAIVISLKPATDSEENSDVE